MFDIGFTELLVLVVLGMVVIGPERLPGVMRTVGKTVGQMKKFMRDMQFQLEEEVRGEKKHDPSIMSDEVEPPLVPQQKAADRKE